jgi:AmpD protein
LRTSKQQPQHKVNTYICPPLEIGNDGWISGIPHCPSPNFDERAEAGDISLLVIHNINLPPGKFEQQPILDFFSNCLATDAHPYYKGIADLKVSSHFLINRVGLITQLVSTDKRAWHAGVSCFEDRERCNDFSIGIELIGSDDHQFTCFQYKALSCLSKAIMRRYPQIAYNRITGHSDIAPGRKTDPGPYFNWKLYKALLKIAA